MNILDTILFGMLAGVITLKVLLLATAAVLLVHVLTRRARRGRGAGVVSRTRHPHMDAHA
jgi:hypothetical protein